MYAYSYPTWLIPLPAGNTECVSPSGIRHSGGHYSEAKRGRLFAGGSIYHTMCSSRTTCPILFVIFSFFPFLWGFFSHFCSPPRLAAQHLDPTCAKRGELFLMQAAPRTMPNGSSEMAKMQMLQRSLQFSHWCGLAGKFRSGGRVPGSPSSVRENAGRYA